jgi:hypothetical protein
MTKRKNDFETTNIADQIQLGICLVVATEGFVWVGETTKQDGEWLHITRGRQVRVWGTSKGLNELVNGPIKGSTELDDPAPVVSITMRAVVAVIPCNDTAWVGQFD